MKNLKVVQLFSTAVFNTKLPKYGILNQKLSKYIYSLKDKDTKGQKFSNVGGWHSSFFNQQDKIVIDFKSAINPIIEKVTKELRWELEKHYIQWENIWSIVNPKYSYNNLHHHGTSHLSCAYYVKLPKENGGDFFFKDPRTSADIVKPAVTSTLPFIDTHSRGGYLHMNTEEGSLLMFPGWLEHGVTQNLSNEDRIVISFNLKLIPKL